MENLSAILYLVAAVLFILALKGLSSPTTALRGNLATPLLGGKIDLTARWGVNDYFSQSLQTAPTVRRENL